MHPRSRRRRAKPSPCECRRRLVRAGRRRCGRRGWRPIPKFLSRIDAQRKWIARRLRTGRKRDVSVAELLESSSLAPVSFSPPLSSKEEALSRTHAAHVFKMVLRFREGFWQEDEFLAQRMHPGRSSELPLSFPHSGAEVRSWWTSEPVHARFLTGWAGGHKAELTA